MAQTKARPPTFVLMASRASDMPEHYQRYLVNSLRESFDLPGTPIRLTVKSSAPNPYAEGGAKSGPERYKGDAKTAPRKVIKAEKAAEALSNLPGKALEQKKSGIKPKVKALAGLKASSSKKAGQSIAVQRALAAAPARSRARAGSAPARSTRLRSRPLYRQPEQVRGRAVGDDGSPFFFSLNRPKISLRRLGLGLSGSPRSRVHKNSAGRGVLIANDRLQRQGDEQDPTDVVPVHGDALGEHRQGIGGHHRHQ